MGFVRPQPGTPGLPADALTFAARRNASQLAGPVRDTVHFGRTPYEQAYAGVTLTPEQKGDVATFRDITAARDLKKLPAHLGILNSPNYQALTRIKGRNAWHNPFTDMFMNLEPKEQAQMITVLEKAAMQAPSRLAQSNTLNVLVDLYFDSLRPGGRLEKLLAGPVGLKRKQQLALRPQLLESFNRLLNPADGDLNRAWQTRYQLRVQWKQYVFQKGWEPNSAYRDPEGLAVRQQMVPLITRLLPDLPARPTPTAALLKRLEDGLKSPDAATLRYMSGSGELVKLVPEWARLVGPSNVQHSDQDFNLADHCLNALDFAKKSPYYQGLSAREKRITAITALLHDIGKESGPCNLQPIIAVDRTHPIKSESAVRQILPSLGFTPDEIETVARLALYHQLLGTMVTHNPDAPPAEAVLEQAAALIPNVSELRMLQAITEGDIRAVKQNSGWFTDSIEDRLKRYGAMVEARIARNNAAGYTVAAQNARGVLADVWAKRTPENSVLETSLEDLLTQMVPATKRVGYSFGDDLHVFRAPECRNREWLVLPYRDAQLNPQVAAGNPLADGLYDNALKQLNLWNTYDFAGSELPYGFLVGVQSENVAFVGAKADFADKAMRQMLDADNAFRQAVTGTGDNDQLRSLWARRLNHSFQPVDIINLVNPVVLATKPVIQGVYCRQKRAGDPLRLPPELLQLVRANRLPVMIVR